MLTAARHILCRVEQTKKKSSLLLLLHCLAACCCAGAELADAVASQMGWVPEDQLVRLEGYSEPWGRVLLRWVTRHTTFTLMVAAMTTRCTARPAVSLVWRSGRSLSPCI